MKRKILVVLIILGFSVTIFADKQIDYNGYLQPRKCLFRVINYDFTSKENEMNNKKYWTGCIARRQRIEKERQEAKWQAGYYYAKVNDHGGIESWGWVEDLMGNTYKHIEIPDVKFLDTKKFHKEVKQENAK